VLDHASLIGMDYQISKTCIRFPFDPMIHVYGLGLTVMFDRHGSYYWITEDARFHIDPMIKVLHVASKTVAFATRNLILRLEITFKLHFRD
jgi:hypothetical protein